MSRATSQHTVDIEKFREILNDEPLHESDIGVPGGVASYIHHKRNLLYNWDFRNIINQRGQATYSNMPLDMDFQAYTVDRWKLFRDDTTVEVDDTNQCINVTFVYPISTTASGGGTLSQEVLIEDSSWYGQNITYSSIIPSSSHPIRLTLVFKNIGKTVLATVHQDLPNTAPADNLYTLTAQIPSSAYTVECTVTSDGDYTGNITYSVERCKLELGDKSTLLSDDMMSHPDELERCREFYREISGDYPVSLFMDDMTLVTSVPIYGMDLHLYKTVYDTYILPHGSFKSSTSVEGSTTRAMLYSTTVPPENISLSVFGYNPSSNSIEVRLNASDNLFASTDNSKYYLQISSDNPLCVSYDI